MPSLLVYALAGPACVLAIAGIAIGIGRVLRRLGDSLATTEAERDAYAHNPQVDE